jgi:hypothetical protein
MSKTEQPWALKLADMIDYNTKYDLELAGTGIDEQAATELRRLHAENEALRGALDLIANTGPDARQCCDIARAALTRAGETK